MIPFGAMVEYYPVFFARPVKAPPMWYQFGKKISPGTFLGHALIASGRRH